MIYLILLFLFTTAPVEATYLYWTPCTTDVQDAGKGELYMGSAFNPFSGHDRAFFYPDAGFILGLFDYRDVKAEAGIDYYVGAKSDPVLGNAKIGVLENKIFPKAPSFSIGVSDFNTTRRKSGQIIYDIVIGKELPEALGGRIFFGGYTGSHSLGRVRSGVMVGLEHSWCKVAHKDGREFDRWYLAADWASGNNVVGGGGFGLSYYFTPDISMQTGPVWFNSAEINGKWKWSISLTAVFPIWSKRER